MIHLFPRPSSIIPVILSLCMVMASTLYVRGQDHPVEIKRVVFLGDSITAGYGLKKEEAYPALIQKLAAEGGHQIKVINAGLSGDTTSGGLRRIRILAKQPIHLLVIALGGNDGLRGIQPKVSQANLEAIIDVAKNAEPNAKIMLVGMQMPENMGKDYTEAFRKMFATVATKKKVTELPFLLEGVAADKSLNLPDGIHPNAQGQVIVANHVYKTIAPLLKGK